MKFILQTTLILLFFIPTVALNAQVGTEFWFVAPDVNKEIGDAPAVLRISSFDQACSITISLPASNRELEQLTIPANSQRSVELDLKDIENSPSNSVNNKGILIVSDNDVAVYYEISNPNNAEKFILKEDNALGDWFLIPSQNVYGNYNSSGSDSNEKADIVATEDNTVVRIVPSVNITGHPANVPFEVSLNRGQTYCLECTDTSGGGALAGTEITSNNRIAVTISDDAIVEDVGSSPNDLIGDQLIPVSALGTEYVAINTSKAPNSFKNSNTVQKVFVMAIEDNTLVFLNNTTKNTRSLQKGEIAEFDISDHAVFIYATKRVYAYQLTGLVNTTTTASNELSSAILPSYRCNGASRVSFTRVFNRDFWVNIIVKRKDVKSFVLTDNEGNVLSLRQHINSWQTVPGQDTGPEAWVCTAVNMDGISTGVPYFLENTSGLFHLCVLDENGDESEVGSSSFGYLSTYNSFWVDGPEQACYGEIITLSAKEGYQSYRWYSEDARNTLLGTDREVDVTETGRYIVEGELFGGCILTDTINVDFIRPVLELGGDTTVCQGEVLTYTLPNNYDSYLWSDGGTEYFTNVPTSTEVTFSLNVSVDDSFGCTNQDTVQITVAAVPTINFDRTEVCEGESVTMTTVFDRYEWSLNGTIINTNQTQNWIVPTTSGVYSITGWTSEGCSITEDINITVNTLPSYTLADIQSCHGETSTINGPAGYSNYLWSTGETTNSIQLNASTNYWLEVTDNNGCVARREASLTINQPGSIDIGPDRQECEGVDISLMADASFSNFNWSFEANSNPGTSVNLSPTIENNYVITNATIANSGIYRIQATDVNGCQVSDEVSVSIVSSNPLTLYVSENLCQGDDIDLIATEGYDIYTWYRGNIHVPAYDNLSQMTNVQNAGTYRVEASTGVCTQTTEIQVTQHALPQVTLPTDIILCGSSSRNLQVSNFSSGNGSGLDYLYWNGDDSSRSTDWSNASFEVSTPGMYYVTVVDEYGCEASDTINIPSYSAQLFDLGEPINLCQNQTVTLVNPVTNAVNYNWYRIHSNTDELLASNSSVQVSQAGVYELRVKDINGCETTDRIDVNVLDNPQVQINGDAIACGQTTLYAASDNNNLNIVWNNTVGQNSDYLTVNTSGTYSVQVTDENGCVSSDQIDVIIHSLPSFSLTSQSACEGEVIQIQGPSGYPEYLWSTGQTSRDLSVTTSGVYSLAIIDANGCSAQEEVAINFLAPVSINLGPDRNECEGSDVTLTAGSLHTNYSWSFAASSTPGNQSSLNANGLDNYVIDNGTADNNGAYIVQATDVNGCPVSDEVLVSFYEVVPESESLTEHMCIGDTIEIVAPEGYDNYTWYIDDVEQTALAGRESFNGIVSEGVYRVEASLGTCVKTSTVGIVQQSVPIVQLEDGLILCAGEEINISVQDFHSSGGSLDYLYWNGDNQVRYRDWQNATLAVNSAGQYSVTAVDVFGCEVTDVINIVESTIPELLGNDVVTCPNELVQVSVPNNFSSYIWSNGDNDSQTNVNTGSENNIELSVSVVDNNGCVASDTIDINVLTIPSLALDRTEVCSGGYVQNTTSFERYEWRLGNRILNVVETQSWIIPDVSGEYSVTAWTADGCSVSDNFNIVVHPLPEIEMVDQEVCAGEAINISAPDGFVSYQWSTGDHTQNISLSDHTNYWVDVTDNHGCVGRANATLSVLRPLEIDLGPDRNECEGVSVSLEADGNYPSYSWYFEASSNPGIPQLLTPTSQGIYTISNGSQSNNGIYRIEAIDNNGCRVNDDVEVNFFAVIAPNLNTTQDLCSGSSIDIEATPGYDTYRWYNNNVHIPSADNLSTLINVTNPGTYRVETVLASCSGTTTISVQEHQNPTILLSDAFLLCKGSDSIISVNNYSSPGGVALDYLYWNTDTETRILDWTNAQYKVEHPGNYSVTAFDINGCSATQAINISSASVNAVNLGDPISACENDIITLNNPVNSNVARYQWSRILPSSENILLSNASLNVNQPGSYKLTVEDLNGCIAEDTVDVNFIAPPSISIQGDLHACVSTSIFLMARGSAYTYQWNGNAAWDNDTLSVNQSGTYTLDVWDDNGCHASDQVDVNIFAMPQLNLQNDTVCSGEYAVLSGPLGNWQYLWSTGQRSSSITASEGSYSLTAIDENGCEVNEAVSVVWRNVPNIDLGPDVIICPLDTWSLDAGTGFVSYEWHNGSSSEYIIANLLDTVNTVVVTDEFGCSGFDMQTVKLKVAPVMEICSDTSICGGEPFEMDAGWGFDEYLWNDGDDQQVKEITIPGEYWVRVSDGCFIFQDTAQVVHLETPVITQLDTTFYAQIAVLAQGGTEPYWYVLDQSIPQRESVFKGLKNGEHEVVVIDENGCQAISNVSLNNVFGIIIPPFFTPNNDGANDLWEIDGLDRFPDSIIKIFNRYGKLLVVYKASDPGWDGRYLGSPVGTDDYWYVIEGLPGGKNLKGHVTLLRE